MQRSPSIIILRIYIRTFVQFRLDASKIAIPRSIVNRASEGGCGQ